MDWGRKYKIKPEQLAVPENKKVFLKDTRKKRERKRVKENTRALSRKGHRATDRVPMAKARIT